ncbi:MAG: hypothetical protein ABI772_07975 [Bacteroidota bacterium]
MVGQQKRKLLFRIRMMMVFFMVAVVISGVTAFDVEGGLRFVLQYENVLPVQLAQFLRKTYNGVHAVNSTYPMIAYGFDWLAFAHIVIAGIFIGPYRNPVKNQWVIEWAMFACIAVLPLALVFGPLRSIPFFWQMIDCSFGVFGILPLYITNRWINQLKGKR